MNTNHRSLYALGILFVLLLFVGLTAACNLVLAPAPTPQPAVTSVPAGFSTPRPIPPSITPLPIPGAGALDAGGAQIAAAATAAAATARAAGSPFGAFTVTTVEAGGVVIQPATLVITPVVVSGSSGDVTVTIPTGEISNIFTATWNTVCMPIFGFVTQTATAMWTTVGLQSGWVGQLVCCLLPGLIVIFALLGRLGFRRFRRWL
ncbi:MAG: hypothetical protein SNJ59_02800 [Aggregatilineales bacterium]